MDEKAYRDFKFEGLLKDQRSPLLEHLTTKGKTAWSQVQQKMYDLAEVDFSKADINCEQCNGTGVVRHAKIGGVLTTIICRCLLETEHGQ